MWQGVAVDRMWIGLFPLLSFHFSLQLPYRLYACAGNGLIGGNHHPLHPVFPVEGRQDHNELDSRAVRVGDYFVFTAQAGGIYLRNHQLFVRVHPPGRRIVYYGSPDSRKLRRPFQGDIASRGKNGDVGPGPDGILKPYNGQLLVPEAKLTAHRTLGSHQEQFVHGEFTLRQDL